MSQRVLRGGVYVLSLLPFEVFAASNLRALGAPFGATQGWRRAPLQWGFAARDLRFTEAQLQQQGGTEYAT